MDKVFIVEDKDLYVCEGDYRSIESGRNTKVREKTFFRHFDTHREAVEFARDYYEAENPNYGKSDNEKLQDEETDINEIDY